VDSFLPLSDRIYGVHLHTNNGREDQHSPWKLDDQHFTLVQSFKPEFISLEGRYPSIASLQYNILQIEKLSNE
jgi:hypothetical protein